MGDFLDCYKSEQFTKGDVVGALAHVLTAGVIGNETELKAWLEDPAVIQRWKNDISATR